MWVDAKTFYQQVKDRAKLTDEVKAKLVTSAVLQTLHWRLPEGEADNVQSSLAPEIQKMWRGSLGMRISKRLGRVEKLSKGQFVSRVQDLTRMRTTADAEKVCLAVLGVLKEAIPAGETKDMLSELPSELRRFVKAA